MVVGSAACGGCAPRMGGWRTTPQHSAMATSTTCSAQAVAIASHIDGTSASDSKGLVRASTAARPPRAGGAHQAGALAWLGRGVENSGIRSRTCTSKAVRCAWPERCGRRVPRVARLHLGAAAACGPCGPCGCSRVAWSRRRKIRHRSTHSHVKCGAVRVARKMRTAGAAGGATRVGRRWLLRRVGRTGFRRHLHYESSLLLLPPSRASETDQTDRQCKPGQIPRPPRRSFTPLRPAPPPRRRQASCWGCVPRGV